MPGDENDDKTRRQWLRVGASAFNLVGLILVFGYVGQRLDQRYGWSPWGALGGLLVGMAGGLWTIIREAGKINR